ncbi:hypothetical protein JL722_1239 [Aureococcus anophagefferens]|nr:hypothetical protein JL722_1239 [Aureococcus anophagefferens]
MRYVSSRGASASVSFEEAIGSGYAADGGLYVPETLPPITADDLEAWKNLDFPALAVEVLRPFVAGEIPDADLETLLAACYGDFLAPGKIPVVPLATAPRVAVAELFHGPTFCFKDLGLQMKKTLSDAINIQRPYNFERVFYYATGGDASKTGAAMAAATSGRSAGRAARTAATRGVDDGAMLAALRAFRDAHGYVCDPTRPSPSQPRTSSAHAHGGPAASRGPWRSSRRRTLQVPGRRHRALGADAWAAYEASAAFPEAARELAGRAEVAPLARSRRAGESLGAAQRRWETVLRAVLEDPDGLHYVESVCHLDDGDDDDPAADEPPAVADSSCAIL